MRKKRILLVSEASYLGTGYSVYGFEIMKRLHQTGKYELCELGSFGSQTDAGKSKLSWGYFPNLPTPNNQQEYAEYHSDALNKFGAWKFEQACLYFRPDVVFSFRDYWMDEFINRSPYRRLFSYFTMPTADSVPQPDLWLANYLKCDRVFAYTQWGKDVLERQSNGQLKVLDLMPPAADEVVFKREKCQIAHKESMGLQADSIILGTVMRNQGRKLYSDLFFSFKRLLDTLPAQIAEKTYLYSHVGYPDQHTDIPKLVRDSGIGRKLLFTYVCKNCKTCFPSYFRDARTYCKKCGQFEAILPTTHISIDNTELAKIYNCFSLYIQYATNEGFGMPLVEAAYCGVPVVGVDYSAMTSILEAVGGLKIPPCRFFCDSGISTYRSLPDNNFFVDTVSKLLQHKDLRQWGIETEELARANFSYSKSAKLWEKHFDEAPLRENWKSPARIIDVEGLQPPFHFNNYEFVEWCVANIIQDRSILDGHIVNRAVRNLNYGVKQDTRMDRGMNDLGYSPIPHSYTKMDFVNECVSIVQHNNRWEQERSKL